VKSSIPAIISSTIMVSSALVCLYVVNSISLTDLQVNSNTLPPATQEVAAQETLPVTNISPSTSVKQEGKVQIGVYGSTSSSSLPVPTSAQKQAAASLPVATTNTTQPAVMNDVQPSASIAAKVATTVVPAQVATTIPATTVPVTTTTPRRTTTTTPSMPAGCVKGVLEDNGRWNCQNSEDRDD
jgi:hypothetical protein